MKVSKISYSYPAMLALTVAMLLAAVASMEGCGKKGPPEPPTGSRPPKVRDLGYGISQNTIKLSWTVPQLEEEAQLPIIGFVIYRARQPIIEKECPNCPIMFKVIGDVPARESTPGQLPITFTETIESGYRYFYKVHGYSADGIGSRSSNFVEFRY